MTVSISVDAMGGDFGPKITVPASLNFLKSHPDASIALVGNESIIKKFLKIMLKIPRIKMMNLKE